MSELEIKTTREQYSSDCEPEHLVEDCLDNTKQWVSLKSLTEWLNEFEPKQTQVSALLDRIKTDGGKI